MRVLKFLTERGKQAPKTVVQVKLSGDSSVEATENVEATETTENVEAVEAKTVVQNTEKNSGN